MHLHIIDPEWCCSGILEDTFAVKKKNSIYRYIEPNMWLNEVVETRSHFTCMELNVISNTSII